MGRAWGPGPVFVYETILESRRWQVYAVRSAFVLTLLGGLALIWFEQQGTGPTLTLKDLAELSASLFLVLAAVQVAVVLLAAPAAAAGSICGDRARGTLAHMMVTDLSDREIVLGKLGSRLTPVAAIVLAAAPVSALGGLMGGLDFFALGALLAETLAIGVFVVALTLAASLRAERPREVLLLVYAVEMAWLLALPFWWLGAGLAMTLGLAPSVQNPPEWFQAANPFVIATAPYGDPDLGTPGLVLGFCGGLLAASAGLLLLTARGLRRAVWASAAPRKRKAPAPGRSLASKLFPSLAGPGLDGNPVLWREWHRNRPTRWERRIGFGLGLFAWGLFAAGVAVTVTRGPDAGAECLEMAVLLQVGFGLLMLSVAAPSALAEERVRGSLDVVLATPLSTRSILAAKWWGMYRRVIALALLPVAAAGFVAATTPDRPAAPTAVKLPPGVQVKVEPVTTLDRALTPTVTGLDLLASGAALVSLGLLLATWMPRVGRAIGLSVCLYLFWGVFWVILAEIIPEIINVESTWAEPLFRWGDGFSPILGSTGPIDEINDYFLQGPRYRDWIAAGVLITLKAALAWGLFALAVRTFDRCLGRVSDRPGRKARPTAPPRIPQVPAPAASMIP